MRITNELNLPEPFVNAAKSEHVYTPKRYSVTSLLKGTCEAILQRRHDDEITQDASEMVWMIFGSAVHKILEESEETATQLKETWVSMDIPGTDYVMSGIMDLYDDKTGEITDWKTASVYKVLKDDWEDYRKQLLYYAVILKDMGFEPKSGKIVAMLKDHSPSKARTEADYPKLPVYQKRWVYTDAEIAAAKQEIIERFKKIAEQEQVPDEELEPCSPSERWDDPPKYAVTKVGNKRASKLCDTEEEAQKEVAERTTGKDKYEIIYRPGEHAKCEKYCTVTKWCPFYQKEKVNA